MEYFYKRVRFALLISAILCSIPILFFWLQHELNLISAQKLAIIPGYYNQWYGIFTIVLVHSGFEHLLFNMIPLFVLLFLVFMFYLNVSFQVILFIIIAGGLGVFFTGDRGELNPVYHVGASGLVFGLITFLISGGFLSMNRTLLVVSLIVVFFYGGTLWGVLPVNPKISWEGHFWGAIAGFLGAFFWRKSGPPKDMGVYKRNKSQEPDEYMIFSYVTKKQMKGS